MVNQAWISTTITVILITYNLHVCLITEPKFEIPSGDPYTGGWCRPQTDGPALRAMALSKWGMVLNSAGQSDTAKSDVWPLVSFDMEWVVENWASTGCDLWEEVRSDNFYFNRFDITVLIFYYNFVLTAFFLKLVQCQSQLNCKIQPFGVKGVRFTHT